ncbi:Butyrophilin-like protein 2, partial [Lemmus lemmus]
SPLPPGTKCQHRAYSKQASCPLPCFPFHCLVDDFRVVGPALPILAKVGEDALLTCQLLPKRTEAAHMEVRWYRSDPDTPVIVHRDGAEVAELQMEEYRGRAEWTEDSTHEGSVALKIHQIQPGDEGQYWCRFQDGDYWKEASVLLRVVGEYLSAQGSRGTMGVTTHLTEKSPFNHTHTHTHTFLTHFLKRIICFYFMCLCVLPVCVCALYVCSVPMEARRGSDILELELEVIVRPLWVLGIKPRSSRRTISALKHWTVSPDPLLLFYFRTSYSVF